MKNSEIGTNAEIRDWNGTTVINHKQEWYTYSNHKSTNIIIIIYEYIYTYIICNIQYL